MKDLLGFAKVAFWPFIVGLAVGMLVLSFGLGFVSSGTANTNAQAAATQASLDALVPLCVTNAQADEAKLDEVLAMPSYKRDDGVAKTGWVIYPKDADRNLKRALNSGCADALKK